jgi:hypothetical protein
MALNKIGDENLYIGGFVSQPLSRFDIGQYPAGELPSALKSSR